MKLSYYSYSIEKLANGKHLLMDIRPFLQAFCKHDDVNYKNSFSHGGEHVYLLPASKSMYLFLITRNQEIIKSISANDLSVGDVHDRLSLDESIGFASYVYIEKSFFAFASTVMAPRFSSFALFMNNIFKSVGITKHEFVVHPLMVQSTKADALGMPFVGKTTIQVNKESNFFEKIRDSVGGTVEEFSDVDSFEVVIKPRKRQNIDAAAKKFINAIPDSGLDKMLVRAKDELQGQLVDLYLAGKGILSDSLDNKQEVNLYNEISTKVSSNEILAQKIVEFEKDGKYERKRIKPIFRLHDVDSWADSIRNI